MTEEQIAADMTAFAFLLENLYATMLSQDGATKDEVDEWEAGILAQMDMAYTVRGIGSTDQIELVREQAKGRIRDHFVKVRSRLGYSDND